MDQFFMISAQWRVVICKHCEHAVWPRNIAGHLKGPRHRLPAKEAAGIKREIESAPVIQDPSDFELIQGLDEPIAGLKVYHDAWTCTAESGCHFTTVAMGTIKNHCAKQHRGVRSRSKYRVQGGRDDLWVRVQCQ